MPHPGITWYCAECGFRRVEGQLHVCKTFEQHLGDAHRERDEARALLARLADLLPRNAPAPPVLAEIEYLGELRRQHSLDAVVVSDPTLGWLIAAYSCLEAARELLAKNPPAANAGANGESGSPTRN